MNPFMEKEIIEVIRKCPIVINRLVTCANLNVPALGSYDILIGMDWIGAHRANIDCYNKTFEFLDEKRNMRVLKGILKVISIRHISAMQLKKLCGKNL